MPFDHEHFVTDGILYLSVTGSGEKHEILALSIAILKRIREYAASLVLIDLRDATGRLGVVDTYTQVNRYPAALRRLRIAIVDVVENREYYAFHENVSANRGFNIRYFNDVPAAKSWLLASPN